MRNNNFAKLNSLTFSYYRNLFDNKSQPSSPATKNNEHI